MLQKAHKGGGQKEALTFGEFLALYEMMAQRPEINKLFAKYSSNKNKWLSPAGLLHFVGIEQGWEHATLDYCRNIISKYEPTREGKTLCMMSIDGMFFWLRILNATAMISMTFSFIAYEISDLLHGINLWSIHKLHHAEREKEMSTNV